MTGQYERIYAIEAQWNIHLHEGDQRPRIDYFHDAVRALTSGEAEIYAKDSRLSIEHLAYDLSQLRHAQAKPQGNRNLGQHHSLSDALVTQEQAGTSRSMDRPTRQELVQLYKDYTVLFAALFAEVADMNFKSREDEIDATVEELATVEQVLKKLANGEISKEEAINAIEELEYDAMREYIQNAIAGQTIYHQQAEQLIVKLQQFEQKLEEEKQAMDTAHTHFVTSRLAVYEASKDMVKKLAGDGLNLAGKFVENALTQSTGRGMGQGM
jgi:hypothetical protein